MLVSQTGTFPIGLAQMTGNIQQQPAADQSYAWGQKVEKNKELLLMMHKLQEVQESFWAKFFRFEKTTLFMNFQKKFTFKQVLRIRLDDIIYLVMLTAICIVFALLPSDTTANSIVGSILLKAYRYFLAFLVLFSMLWLISTNWYRHFVFALVCILFPLLTLLTYYGVIPFDQIDLTTTIFSYIHILSLWVVYGALYIVYPIKQFVRNKIGSLYSYLFGLSTLTLFMIWPAYSLIEQMAVSMQVTFNFITENKALIITFLVIVVFTFHLFTHQTFFEGSLLETKRILLIDFTKAELTQALADIDGQIKRQNSMIGNKDKEPTTTFLYRNYAIYTRFMSFIMFAFTIAIEIYVFLYLASNLTQIYRSIAVMVFCIAFSIYGCIMNLLPISRQSTLYFFSIISLVPAALSPLYCSTCTVANTFGYYEYIFLATALPYTTIFWCVVRSLSRRRPLLKLNILVTMYIFVHIPLTLFMINNLGMISADSTMVAILNIILLGIVALIASIGLIGFVLWLCFSVKQLPKQDKSGNSQPVDYNYFEQGNPTYVPYVKKQSFSLSWLSSLDIRNLSQLFNCINFIVAELVTMYIFNELSTTLANVQLTSNSTRYIVYAQFYITFAYFTYAYSYIVFKYNDNENIIVILVLIVVGLFGVIFSYVNQQGIYLSFRIGGGFSIAIAGVAIGLHVVKNNNKDIMNFLSGVLVILLWIFLILPYAIALPIATIYISSSYFGEFIYACILGSTLLLVVLVSIMSIVFNMLMNKFEGEKKIKFMVEDVETFLKEEGVETEDEVLHILHQSYENRDQKYVFFMRRGFPIRLFKDPKDQESLFKTVVYNHEILNRKESQENIPEDDKPEDYCWLCLTFFCGVDQSELEQRANKVKNQNMIDEDQMQQLMPEDFFKHVFTRAIRQPQTEEKKYVDLSKLYSSKSIILRHLTTANKHLGQEFSILKTRKNKKLANQILHIVYNFLANEDDPPAKIIFNDFLVFCSIIDIPNLSKNEINTLFLDFSSNSWKGNTAIDINDFSILIQELVARKYPNAALDEESKYSFLLETIYPALCNYAEFQDVMNERRIKTTKQNSLMNSSNIAPGSEFSQNFSSIRSGAHLEGFARKVAAGTNLYSLPEQQLQQSPFITSFERHKKIKQKLALTKNRLNQKKVQNQFNKLIEPAKQQKVERKKKEEKVEKSKSCKLVIYEKYQSCKSCCKKIEEQQVVIKRKSVKPWDYLAVQAIRIMEHKDQEWKEQKKDKQYEFRLILNNILIAVFKLADLYTFMEITIMNPEIGWQSEKTFSILTFEFRIQLYASFAVVLICAVLGIKGITYIFEDRLGLTETRVPAVFPHPMFFFTFIYKLLILSLFNTIIMTLFSTFMCDWTTGSSVFKVILKSTQTPLECFGAEHNIYVICSIISILLYYPLSAYTMPNFQFSEKRLDLKYKPSYLIIYFQVNFILAAGKVLLSQMVDKTQAVEPVQILFQSLNIFSIALLGLMVIVLRPCLISWFNVVQFLVIWIGLVWNVLGLVLYLTNQWLICIIVGGGVSALSIIFAIVFIRRTFFSAARVQDEIRANDFEDLELAWKYKKQYNYQIARFEKVKMARQLEKDEQTDNDNEDQKVQIKNKNSHKPLVVAPDEARTNYGSNKVIKPPIQLMEPGQN